MIVLQIQHEVLNFEGWKKTFDSDPINRKKSGVRSYRIFRQADNPNYVIVDLEFDDVKEAEDMLAALRTMWTRVEGTIIIGPQIRMLELV